MLEKHRNLIKKNIFEGKINDLYVNNGCSKKYTFEVYDNLLKIRKNDLVLKNTDNNDISVWNINEKGNEVSIIINRVNSVDVAYMIALINTNNKEHVTLKQTPTDLYVSYLSSSINYELKDCNTNLIMTIIEDYFNKNGFINTKDILKFLKEDIDNLFNIMFKNNDAYIESLKHQLNNINANYIMESQKVKRKINLLNDYKILSKT